MVSNWLDESMSVFKTKRRFLRFWSIGMAGGFLFGAAGHVFEFDDRYSVGRLDRPSAEEKAEYISETLLIAGGALAVLVVTFVRSHED